MVNLNTAYQDEGFQVIDNRCAIFCQYLKTWLLIDLLSVLPIELIIDLFTADSTGAQTPEDPKNIHQFIRLARISKLYKLVKIT